MAVETMFAVQGIHCGGCEDRLETVLGRLESVIKANADHTAARVTVRFDEQRLSQADIRERIRTAGYEVA